MSVGRRMSDAEQKALHCQCVALSRQQTRNLLADPVRAIDPASTGLAIGTPRGGSIAGARRPGGGAPKRARRPRSPLPRVGSEILPKPTEKPAAKRSGRPIGVGGAA